MAPLLLLKTTRHLGTTLLKAAGQSTSRIRGMCFTLFGATQTKSLTRLPIGPASPVCEFTTGSRASASNYTDAWRNASESGWGIHLFQQQDNIYAKWFTYDSAGRDTWYVVSGTNKQADGSFRGVLYRVKSGVPQLQLNAQPAFAASAVEAVGEMVFKFSDGETGTMTYTVNGLTQSKNITRLVYASPVQVCRNGTPTNNGSGGGGGSNSSSQCHAVLAQGKTRRFKSSGSTGQVEIIERGVGAASFDGKAGQAWDQFNQQNQRTGRVYARVNADGGYEYIGSESFDPVSGVKTGQTRFTGQTVLPDLAVGASNTNVYTGIVSQTGQPDQTINYTQTFTRRANQNVTVLAGTYQNACIYDGVSDASTTVQGMAFTTRAVSKSWNNTREIGLKVETTATSTLNGLALPADSSNGELVQFTD
jgi:hypothetical protein